MDRIIQDSDNSDAEDEPLVAAPVDCDIISTIRTAPNSSESVNNAYNVPGLIDCEKTPGVRATNSSERIMRQQLETAHLALFDSTPSGTKFRTEDDTVFFVTQSTEKKNKLKRTKTMSVSAKGDEGREGSALKRRKTTQIYGGKKSRAKTSGELWDVPSSSDGAQRSTAPDVTSASVISISQKSASMRQVQSLSKSSGSDDIGTAGFLAHNPNEMFPDSMSTVESRGKALEVSQSEEEHTRISMVAEASEKTQVLDVACSTVEHTHMSTTYRGPMTETSGVNGSAPLTLEDQQQPADHLSLDEDVEHEKSKVPTRRQSVVVQISKSLKVVGHDLEIQKEKQEAQPRDLVLLQEEDTDVEKNDDFKKQGGVHKIPVNHNMPCPKSLVIKLNTTLSNHEHTDKTDAAIRKSKRTPQVDPSTDEVDSDELAIGLPEEKYQPRPSRSRGARGAIDTKSITSVQDFQKSAKSRLRRNKTTGTISAYSSSLREMGFRSSQVEVALADTNGNFDDALEVLTSRNDVLFGSQQSAVKKVEEEKKVSTIMEEDEPDEADGTRNNHDEDELRFTAKSIEKKSQVTRHGSARGRPKKQKVVEEDDMVDEESLQVAGSSDEDVTPMVKQRKKGPGNKKHAMVEEDEKLDEETLHISEESEQEEQVTLVVEAKKKGRGRKKKQELIVRDETIEEAPAHVNDSSEDEATPVVPVVEAKKNGRGRPKKVAKVAEEHAGSGEDDSNPLKRGNAHQATRAREEGDVLHDLDPNSHLKDAQTRNTSAEHDQEKMRTPTPPKDNPKLDRADDRKTPEKLPAPAPAGAKPHSPLKTARVPLKVGLSRRARIEPLLRIVRK